MAQRNACGILDYLRGLTRMGRRDKRARNASHRRTRRAAAKLSRLEFAEPSAEQGSGGVDEVAEIYDQDTDLIAANLGWE